MSKHIMYKGQKYVRVDNDYVERVLRQTHENLADMERGAKDLHNRLTRWEKLASDTSHKDNEEVVRKILGCSEEIRKAHKALWIAYSGWK